MNIWQLAERNLRELLRGRDTVVARLLAAYAAAWDRLQKDLDALAAKVKAAEDRGLEPAVAWDYQKKRLELFKDQLAEEILSLAKQAVTQTAATQQRAVTLAEQHAATVLKKVSQDAGIAVDFNRLPADVVKQYVGFMGDGSPLEASFKRLARDMGLKAADVIDRAISNGIAAGDGIGKIFTDLRKEIDGQGGNPYQDPEVVRRLGLAVHSSVLFSYRETTRASYKEAGVTQWRWLCTRSPYTCPACWALDGKIFDTDTPQGTHPNCKCTLLPIVGEPGDTPTGPDLFEKLTDAQKKAILGSAAFAAYKAGAITLSDLVREVDDPDWGTQRTTASLTSILGNKARKYLR